jgi:hypothetical protein
VIKHPFHSYLFAALWTGDLRQWLRIARIDRRTAGWACLYHRELPLIAAGVDSNIQMFRGNEMATRVVAASMMPVFLGIALPGSPIPATTLERTSLGGATPIVLSSNSYPRVDGTGLM